MLIQLVLISGLAAIHLLAGKLRYLNDIPRSSWLSFAGGISVAYVFIHIFPELEEAQRTLGEQGIVSFVEHHAYLVALAGLSVFYGLERLVKQDQRTSARQRRPGKGMFWLHIGSFTLYNALIGYLLVYREGESHELLFYFLAMAFHFLVNDHGLYQHHRESYLHRGRWVLASAVVIGWLVGLNVQVSEAATSTLFAFLAGGVVLNVLKEELPEERLSRFWPFAVGAVTYSALLLIG
ncbi:hypothetical protein GCM10007159_35760 [Modicisalibacter luteus]|jgi:zinc transporter ZupT|nr:hypothetical protein GCM10007159_35760 [Halomonas lutea]